jgi:hypothetical protein
MKGRFFATGRYCVLLAATFILWPTLGRAQDAIVTFYSHWGNFSGLPGNKHSLFAGNIYDGSKLLFGFRDGFFIRDNRFVILKLTPGVHTFTASHRKFSSKDGSLTIDLEPGKSYFLRAQSHSNGIVAVEFDKGSIDRVTCEVAYREAKRGKPLGKSVAPEMSGRIVPMKSLPRCQ